MKKTNEEKIAENQQLIEQLQNRNKQLQKQAKENKRKADTHRKVKRGGYVESLIEGAADMSDGDFYRLMETAVRAVGMERKISKSALTDNQRSSAY